MEFYNYNRSLIYVNTYIEVFCLILQSEIREVFFLLILQSKIRFAIDELPEKYPNPGPAIMSPSSRSLGDIPALSARMRLGFRKKWRLAPRALSCFMRRSFDLLFWNHTWKKKILILKPNKIYTYICYSRFMVIRIMYRNYLINCKWANHTFDTIC